MGGDGSCPRACSCRHYVVIYPDCVWRSVMVAVMWVSRGALSASSRLALCGGTCRDASARSAVPATAGRNRLPAPLSGNAPTDSPRLSFCLVCRPSAGTETLCRGQWVGSLVVPSCRGSPLVLSVCRLASGGDSPRRACCDPPSPVGSSQSGARGGAAVTTLRGGCCQTHSRHRECLPRDPHVRRRDLTAGVDVYAVDAGHDVHAAGDPDAGGDV